MLKANKNPLPNQMFFFVSHDKKQISRNSWKYYCEMAEQLMWGGIILVI